MDNSSVYDIHIGLKVDEEQVRVGRETEVKRMLEFEVYEEVNEQQAHGKRIWNSAWLVSQEKTRTSVRKRQQRWSYGNFDGNRLRSRALCQRITECAVNAARARCPT